MPSCVTSIDVEHLKVPQTVTSAMRFAWCSVKRISCQRHNKVMDHIGYPPNPALEEIRKITGKGVACTKRVVWKSEGRVPPLSSPFGEGGTKSRGASRASSVSLAQAPIAFLATTSRKNSALSLGTRA